MELDRCGRAGPSPADWFRFHTRRMKERSPIFYDAERVRWRRPRRVLEISGALLTLLLVYFFLNIAASVELPAALLPDSHSLYYRAFKGKLKPAKATLTREGRHRRV